MNRALLLTVLMFSACPWSRAELAPSVYEQMQTKAPEFLDIEVLRVDVGPGDAPERQTVRLMALVNKVNRSASGVRTSDVINITFTRTDRPKGWVGPGEIPLPAERDTSVAYLKRDPDTGDFFPVAGAMSFRDF
jgi:hypothetical protein